MSPSSGDPAGWDTANLKDELQRCTETRDKLLHGTSQMREMISELEGHLKNETDSLLRQQYEEQAGKNTKLEEELNHLQQELAKQRGFGGVGGPSKGLQAYDGMSQVYIYTYTMIVALKQLLRKLEKEKVEIEWQLKEMEWRLDQESSAVSKAKEEREAILDQLAQLSLEVDRGHVTRRDKKGTPTASSSPAKVAISSTKPKHTSNKI